MSEDRDAAARAWAAHLRDGGTTEWRRWAHPGNGRAALPAAADQWGTLPGAPQLELLRRLNLEGPLPQRVDHVLRRSGPGRGAAQRALPWPPRGPAAPSREVLRVATGVLADLVVQLPAEPAGGSSGWPRRPRPIRGVPTFVLDGLPVTVAGLRADLAAAGMFEHRPRQPWFGGNREDHPDVVVVVVGPVADSFREVWSRRVQDGSGRLWRRFLGSSAKQDALPGATDPLRTVAHWADRIGAANVHLVTTAGLHDQVRQVLGRRPGTAAGSRGRRPGDPADLAPAQLDVLRRLNGVLPFLVAGPEQDAARARLISLLGDASEVATRPARLEVPARRRAWVRTTGGRLEQRLREAGCTVHGDLAVLHEAGAANGVRLRAGEVLEATLRMIHRVDAATAPAGGGPR